MNVPLPYCFGGSCWSCSVWAALAEPDMLPPNIREVGLDREILVFKSNSWAHYLAVNCPASASLTLQWTFFLPLEKKHFFSSGKYFTLESGLSILHLFFFESHQRMGGDSTSYAFLFKSCRAREESQPLISPQLNVIYKLESSTNKEEAEPFASGSEGSPVTPLLPSLYSFYRAGGPTIHSVEGWLINRVRSVCPFYLSS